MHKVAKKLGFVKEEPLVRIDSQNDRKGRRYLKMGILDVAGPDL